MALEPPGCSWPAHFQAFLSLAFLQLSQPNEDIVWNVPSLDLAAAYKAERFAPVTDTLQTQSAAIGLECVWIGGMCFEAFVNKLLTVQGKLPLDDHSSVWSGDNQSVFHVS